MPASLLPPDWMVEATMHPHPFPPSHFCPFRKCRPSVVFRSTGESLLAVDGCPGGENLDAVAVAAATLTIVV